MMEDARDVMEFDQDEYAVSQEELSLPFTAFWEWMKYQ